MRNIFLVPYFPRSIAGTANSGGIDANKDT